MKRHLFYIIIPFLLIAACQKQEIEPVEPVDPVPTDGTPIMSEWPQPASLWQDHMIALVDSISAHRARLTLLSFFDWTDQPSANNPELGDNCTLLSEGYEESDLTGWTIPTSAQARAIRELYYCSKEGTPSHALDKINEVFDSLGYPGLASVEGSQNARYLCDEGRKSFSLVEGTSISQAGTSKSDYHLRLVYSIEVYILGE